jgi:type IV pilus assembly protein PilO
MAMKSPDLSAFKAIPMQQKVLILIILLSGIGYGYWYFFDDPLQTNIDSLKVEIGHLDTEINKNKEKVKNLEELKRANAELEKQLAKNQERLPPEEEAAQLLKQLNDLGTRIGLNLRLWRPSARQEDPSKLFVKLPTNVEMSGGYHTLALFFDRISKFPRIVNVSNMRMGSAKAEKDRISIQATFQITAFASPSAAAAPPATAAPAVTAPGKK